MNEPTPEDVAEEIVATLAHKAIPYFVVRELPPMIAAAIRTERERAAAAHIEGLEAAAKISDMCASVSLNERPDAVHVAIEIRLRIAELKEQRA